MIEGKLIYKSDDDIKKELNKRIKAWKKGESKDGFIQAAEGKFKYKNIAYLIKVHRYFDIHIKNNEVDKCLIPVI